MNLTRFKREDGQVSLAVVLLSIAIIAAAVGVFIFGEANDARTRAQKGADASALGAARDAREAFLPAFARSHKAPPKVTPTGTIHFGTVVPPTTTFMQFTKHGKSAAFQFAQKNGTGLTDHRAIVNRFTSEVQSNEEKVESPVGSKARKSMSAPAEATAKVKTDEVTCYPNMAIYTPIKNQPELQMLKSWSITCSRNGHTETLKYVPPSPMAVNFYGNEDKWRKIFDIDLID